MAKPVKTIIKVQLPAGKATPAPPLGPALGQHGVNIGEFVSKFNAATAQMGDNIVPAEITIYQDRTFDFKLKTSPASALLRKAAGVEKGAANPLTGKVGKISKAQLKEIAEKKMEDLNADDVEAAMKIVAGTARSMGIEVRD
ncbi:50S ribosomal protein L11 [Candidatus Giovannonibacteria bacterium]|nr:50S ribosomal protein L11 [Candidatus Giovannonibacteria bacterium]